MDPRWGRQHGGISMNGHRRFARFALLLGGLAIAALAPLAVSRPAMAAGRTVALSENADYFGGDYETVKDVDLGACQTLCMGDAACKAFTYNKRARWCFKKNAVGRIEAAEGAIAGRVVEAGTDAASIRTARLGELVWLPKQYKDDAAKAERDIAAMAKPAATQGALRAELKKAVDAGDFVQAIDLLKNALRLAPDRVDLWGALSEVDLKAAKATSDDSYRDQLRGEAPLAAVSAYLRSSSDGDRILSLQALASGLAADEEWKDALRALRQRLELGEDATWRATYEDWTGKHGFRVTDNSVDTASSTPRICVSFSDPIRKADPEIASYVKVEGDETIDVETEDDKLCVVGVDYGKRYHLTIRKGLPALEPDVALIKSVDLDVYVRDRDPSVRFLGRAYVLPAVPEATIPVVSVNVDTIEARLMRIGDRNLAGAIDDDRFMSQLDQWQADQIADNQGREIWKGKVLVKRDTNHEVTTAIAVRDLVKTLEPGVYALTARAETDTDSWSGDATQWFVVSDLGLSTLSGNDGLHVVVRSLATAKAMDGIRLALVARDNEILGEAVTDASGYARFDAGLMKGSGGATAALLTARSEGDYAFIDLGKAPFDLTDRGVLGREPPRPVDVFMTTERGVYRPGESVALTVLARDSKAVALADVPLTLVIRRPDGNEYLRRLLADEGAGGRAFLFDLPTAAMRGAWRASVYADPKADALRTVSFKVEDFQPERLDFTLTTKAKSIADGGSVEASVKADWLYGAPASGLGIEGEVELKAASGLDAAPGYRFGLADDDFMPNSEDVEADETDDNGEATVTLTAPAISSTTLPLVADVHVRVVDTNGRPVERTMTLPIASTEGRIGIRPGFDGSVDEGGNARFKVIALDGVGERTSATGLRWTLSRVITHYQWYRQDGSWDYHAVESTERVGDGTVAVGADVPADIEGAVAWGKYRLEVEDPAEKLLPASVVFNAGWYVASSAADTPDLLKVSLDKPRYRVGDTVTAHLETRFPGIATVAVVDDRLIAMKTVEVTGTEADVALDVTDDWGPGAYVTATLVRPLDVAARRMPSRALGLAWAGIDPGDRRLDVGIDAPERIRPQTSLDVAVKVAGVRAGETAYVTIAAVDVGILNMTGFTAPAPEDWYFAQRRLGVEFRDVYGQLIDTMIGARGEVRSGGDGGGVDRLKGPPPTEKLVAFFQGVTEADADGVVRASFPVPDFSGTVKVMAVAWSKTGVGHADADVLVRDPVVIQAALPGFLAPGDTSRLKLDFTHVEGPAGRYHLSVAAEGDAVALDPESAERDIDLAEKGRAEAEVAIRGVAVGDGTLVARLKAENGDTYAKELTLGVRDNAPPVSRVHDVDLAAGASTSFEPGLFAGLRPETAAATVTIGTVAGVDLPGLVHALDTYPYGCSEQLTSRALPLLYLDDVALAAGLASDEPVKQRVTKAIAALMDHQKSSGSFGLWGPSGDDDDLWLDAYVSDFLTRAREKGYEVPAVGFDLAVTNLKNEVAYASDFTDGGEGVAYALYVLARNGRASIGDLHYFAEAKLDQYGSPLAMAQLGAALALYGEPQKAAGVFRAAFDRLETKPESGRKWRADYGSDLRDGAAMLALVVESRIEGGDLAGLTRRVGRLYQANGHTSTQEDAWLLVAANAVLASGDKPVVEVGGNRVEGIRTMRLDARSFTAPLMIRNDGAGTVSARVTVTGVPVVAPPAESHGYELTRSYFDLDGNEVDPAEVPLGTRMVVVLDLTASDDEWARLVIDDPLPAGLAIDNPALIRAGEVSALDWLDPVETVAHSEYRTDRFVAAFDRQGEETDYQFAYMVRAVAPGHFAMPAATVVDMYRPEKTARTAAGEMVVDAKR